MKGDKKAARIMALKNYFTITLESEKSTPIKHRSKQES